MSVRNKRIEMRMPPALINAVDKFCELNALDRTSYFEMLIRADLKRRNLFPEKKSKQPHYYDCDIEDMPLHPIEIN